MMIMWDNVNNPSILKKVQESQNVGFAKKRRCHFYVHITSDIKIVDPILIFIHSRNTVRFLHKLEASLNCFIEKQHAILLNA